MFLEGIFIMLFMVLGILVVLAIIFGVVMTINQNKRRRAARLHMQRLDDEARRFYQSNNH